MAEMVRPDGSVIDYAALPMPDGATLVTFADVSAAKREEHALIERNEALIAADRLKSQFISHVSYEFALAIDQYHWILRVARQPAHR